MVSGTRILPWATLSIAMATACGLAPSPAAAQAVAPADDARARFEAARALFDRGNFDAALTEFERVYELMGPSSPRRYVVLFNIAQSHERVFRYDEALHAYQRYLDEGGPDAEDRVTVQATMRALDGLLGTVSIRLNIPSGEVWVDDRRVGPAPGTMRIPGGRHVVQIRAPGYMPAQQEVQLPARATRDLVFALDAAHGRRGLPPFWFIGSTVLAGVAVLTGAGIGTAAVVMRSNDLSALQDPARRFGIGTGDQQAIRNTALVADISFGAAVLFGGTSLVLLLLTDWHGGHQGVPHPATSALPRMVPSCDPLAPGMTLVWTM